MRFLCRFDNNLLDIEQRKNEISIYGLELPNYDEHFQVFEDYELKDYLLKYNLSLFQFGRLSQDEFEYIINIVKDNIDSITFFQSKTLTNLDCLRECKKLRSVYMYYLPKVTSLWEINESLKYLWIEECNKITSFKQLESTNIEHLWLYGCNMLSSFTPKLIIDDFNVFNKMRQLKTLNLRFQKMETDSYYLEQLSKLRQLEELNVTDNIFTFEQFAWLQSRLPNTKGLEAYSFIDALETYMVIGRRKPKSLKDKTDADNYKEKYLILIDKYKGQEFPPGI